MNLWPVIVRELRQQARQRFTFTLRVLGAGLGIATATLFAMQQSFDSNLGGWLFAGLHVTLFFAIWILVPLSASDCISRERREGTLGLLFLTPLRAREIVLAKAGAHGLRALTFLLAVLPVFTIPFLIGGVSWEQASLSALVNFSSICWALGATLVASATTRNSLRALVLAVVLSIGALFAHAIVLGALSAPRIFFTGNLSGFLDERLLYGLAPPGLGTTRLSAAMMPRGALSMISGGVQNALLALLVLYGAALLAAILVRRTWREEPPPEWVQSLQRTFCTPVLWRKWLQAWMRWKIERNPVGWLEQRRWTGRLVTWTWFAIVISIYTAIVTDRNFFRGFSGMQETLAWLMIGSIAASAAGSFRRERETGVLELLLVSPLSAKRILHGRLLGLWGQFLPAMAALLLIWLYFQSIFRRYDDVGRIIFFGGAFLTLPVIGLYFSLRSRNYLSAFLVSLLMGVLLPLVVSDQLRYWWHRCFYPNRMFDDWLLACPLAAILQLAFAAILLLATGRRLEQRRFPLERAAW